jgi:hypothetical protein
VAGPQDVIALLSANEALSRVFISCLPHVTLGISNLLGLQLLPVLKVIHGINRTPLGRKK